MARPKVRVTRARRKPAEVPEEFVEFVALLVALNKLGLLERIEEHVSIERKSGAYSGFDVFVFLLCSLCLKLGLRKTYEDHVRPHGPKLAAVAGRSSLPSSSAVSGALKACTPAEGAAATDWLLTASVLTPELLHDPAVAFYDTVGECWHLFGYDPTVHAMRQRALPEGDDLPPARRRTTKLAAPGRSGRKRGEAQLSRPTLLHVGAGLWVSVDVEPGNSFNLQLTHHSVADSIPSMARSFPPEFPWVAGITEREDTPWDADEAGRTSGATRSCRLATRGWRASSATWSGTGSACARPRPWRSCRRAPTSCAPPGGETVARWTSASTSRKGVASG